MPNKNTIKGSRKVSKKETKQETKPKTSKKVSKKLSKNSNTSKKYNNVSNKSTTEDMRDLLSSSDDNNNDKNRQQYNQQSQYNQQPQYNQQQAQAFSPSQVDPMMINNFVPYQEPQNNFMGMQSQNMMSTNQMVQGLQNFAGNNEQLNNSILSPSHQQMNSMQGMNNMQGMTPQHMVPMNQMGGGDIILGLKNFI